MAKHPDLMPKFDRLGRTQKDPRRLLHGVKGALHLAEMGVLPKVVPAAFWTADVDEEGDPVAVVACPCGASPVVALLAPLAECPGECERYFFFDSATVWSFNSPRDKPAEESEEVSPP